MPRKNHTIVQKSFDQLSSLVEAAGIQLKREEHPPIKQSQRVEPQRPSTSNGASECNEDEVFRTAMNDVHPASWRHDPYPSSQPVPLPAADPDSEDLRLMQTAVAENVPVPVLDHPEYIEGWIGVAGRRFLPKLRNGLYSIQGQLDLHGYNRMEAQIAVEDFVARMARFQSCCIKIIHGRGINSPTDKPTIKESLQRLLRTRRFSRYVVAYASAPACDGGVGAVYVLLRRQ
ncbi:MAG: Smr/MutS family protein [Acidobacteria bacterium]|nr:Smr/MutS family protein [Acidobacteriota bacterium]